MVYCGKASLGCQNCRIRRIKCDRKRPECSQCIRVAKKCPGYRDQLSLMFRDESSKVIQKAHAQWGGSPVDSSSSSSSSSSSGSSSPPTAVENDTPTFKIFPVSRAVARQDLQSATVDMSISPNLDERGLQFYITRYLMNHPDAPIGPDGSVIYVPQNDVVQNAMIAVGLAGLGNMGSDKHLTTLSRQRYTMSLRETSSLIASTPRTDVRTVGSVIRSIVTLALYEVVHGSGTRASAKTANVHINGAVALLRSVLPLSHLPDGGTRVVLQVLFSLFIPSQMTEAPLAPAFFECLKSCQDNLEGSPERVCVDLAMTIARLVQLSSILVKQKLSDESPEVEGHIRQLLTLRVACDRLEKRLWETYPFVVEYDDLLPPMAAYHGTYHTYTEIWSARIWNHFRWARILILQILTRLSDDFPISGYRCVPAAVRGEVLSTIKRMSTDLIVSTTSHWHHPILDKSTAKKMEAPSKGGTGAVGLPTFLWHLKVAACAPGVDDEAYDWVYNVMQVVWKDMGMQHARLIVGFMDEYKIGVEKEALNRILKLEEDDDF
ncbi:RNA polymerase II-specific transcription factor-like protein [Microdochium nivale]|nr:RNA polymerase II-specific transcription factor-like protein [Microdochium nivale]